MTAAVWGREVDEIGPETHPLNRQYPESYDEAGNARP
jgi:hypothetical protein